MWLTKYRSALILGVAVGIGVLIGTAKLKGAIAIYALLLGVPAILAALASAHLGTMVIISVAYVLLGVKRLSPGVPLGIVTDVFLLVLVLGIVLRRVETHDWSTAKTPVAVAVFIWMVYVFLQVLNPLACSYTAWLITIRSTAGYMLMYFVAIDVLDRPERIRFYVWFWIAWSIAVALYAFKQEYVGFSSFEWVWMHGTRLRFRLLYQWGLVRKFSFLSDPVAFGLNMAYTGLLAWAIVFGAPKRRQKMLAAVALVLLWWAMVFSGTRAAYVAIPMGLFFYGLLMANRRVFIGGAVAAFALLVLIMVPTHDQHLKRFRSAFQPQESRSYMVRIENQARIRPFIWSHPFGGGLGSTGDTGRRFCRDTLLGGFPPDSGYVRVAVELGWFGLLLHLGTWVTVLWVGVRNHYGLRDPFLRAVSAGTLAVFFALAVVNYAQQAIFQLPTSLLFWLSAAMIDRAPALDRMALSGARARPG